ncbi:MAG: 3-isopropylmalate dehydratase large subunit [Actinobacteria bacterium]|nr:MAG: 3-isopropylmalate dehydratase large subunit [Actinomycetota bacterium]
MAQTITEKIIAKHTEENQAKAGSIVSAKVDLVLANDITAPLAIKELEKAGIKTVFDPEKIALVPDHFVPNKDIKSAEQAKLLREFAAKQKITNYFEVGRMGIEHALLPEQGLVKPGDLIVGADSHTCTYGALGAFATGMGSTDIASAMALGETWLIVPQTKLFNYRGKKRDWVSGKDFILYTIGQIGVDGALYESMEFTGDAIENLSIDGRLSMCNMAIEAGAKNGIIAPDDATKDYLKGRVEGEIDIIKSDEDAKYVQTYDINVEDIELQVALPCLPSNSKGVSEIEKTKIDQVIIGSCTNGRLEDLRTAAKILKGKKVAKSSRLIVIPATQNIYKQALDEGLIDIFLESEAAVSTPTCGPCLGGYMGVLAEGEKALATTNRNFKGRMGHLNSEVYLSGPAVAAASAIAGYITSPEDID